jgi:hypothetical protein
MDKTDLSLILSTLCALDLFLGAVAALVVAAFVAGMLWQARRPTGSSRP